MSTTDTHGFNVSVATIVGVPQAIMIQHLLFLQKTLVRVGENWQQVWVKRSAKSLTETYPYWSGKQISRILDDLEKDGYIVSKIDNQFKGDRSKSFLLTQSGLKLVGSQPFAQTENGLPKQQKPIFQTVKPFAQTENDICPNGEMLIKEDYISYNSIVEEKENAQNALTPPFHHVGSIEIPNSNIPLEAEKANDFTGAGPGAEFLVTTITPQAPYIRIAERVEIPETPGPKSPGEKIREMCAVNHKIRETFSMVRKIPASKFDEYLTAFDAEKTGLPIPQTWKNDNDLVMNFWAWSEIRYGKEQRNAGQPQRQGNGRGAQLQNSGSDHSKYDQPQKF